jgi:hypothetical protein
MARDMGVWLESVAVKDLGPLGERTFDLGRLNLIYGHNETGKTFLVEFLLHSLFRKSSDWSFRDLSGQGKVVVRGLDEESIDFTPEARKKLEDYWEGSGVGLPTNMARLLVVKGGELELAESMAGIDRGVLKTVLSSEVLLDQIQGRISKTVQGAVVKEGRIVGNTMGEIKSRKGIKEERDHLETLFSRVDKSYSRGGIRSLELRKEELSDDIDELKRAKRHEAYQLHAEREDLTRKRDQLDDGEIDKLKTRIHDQQRTKREIVRKQGELDGLEGATDDFEWVQHAVRVWESLQMEKVAAPRWFLLILGVLGIAAGFVAGLFQYVTPAIIAFAFGVLFTGFYMLSLLRQAQAAPLSEERSRIESEFSERFGRPLSNLAALQAAEENLHEDHLNATRLAGEIAELEGELEEFRSDIDALFNSLLGSTLSEDGWEDGLEGLKSESKRLDDEIHKLDVRLSSLNVDESDYVAEKVKTAFSAEKLGDLEVEFTQIEEAIKQANRDLENLKQSICDETDDAMSVGWPVVLEHLRERKRAKDQEYRELTAEIIAKIGVMQVLNEVKQEEDEKIQRGLEDPTVLETLERVTGAYKGLRMTDGQILVSGEFGNYPMDQLSTGAKEQILLALRMGFSTRLAGGEPLFLILDDAFQHSDWDRRERLVEKTADLAKDGWQITYLSMDDHIRGLFETAGQKNFKSEFRSYRID